MLTTKMIRFCEEYLKDLNGANAARRAGYSKKTANSIAFENLQKPEIKEKIRELQEELQIQTGVTAKMVVEELSRMAFWSIKDFIASENSINDLSQMDRTKLVPVTGIKIREKYEKDINGDPVKVVEAEIKMAAKLDALEKLGRHLGVFKEDNEQKKMTIKVTRK